MGTLMRLKKGGPTEILVPCAHSEKYSYNRTCYSSYKTYQKRYSRSYYEARQSISAEVIRAKQVLRAGVLVDICQVNRVWVCGQQ